MSQPVLVLSSRNQKKIREILELLSPWGIEVRGVETYPGVGDVVEDGTSFEVNATKKAREVALQVKEWTLAEDSGLCVDALNGEPGIYSARYAGEPGSDERNNQKLLTELAPVPTERRGAHYVCHAVLVDPQGEVRAQAVGRCYGRILREYHGGNGFGYDPLFEIVEYRKTFGELPPAVKRHLSHRARAFEEMIPQIVRLLRSESAS